MSSDIPSLTFVDPDTTDERWRVVLFGAPGVGKTVAACSAPGPIVAVSADRPGAYRYSRRHHTGKKIDEARFAGSQTLREVYEHVAARQDEIGTVILDPFGAMYDEVVRENTGSSGKPNWQKVNDVLLGALRAFRDLDVNLVLVAHERREQDENAETEPKVFPHLGGPALVQKVMAEVDIVARVFRKDPEDPEGDPTWLGQLVTARGYQCKDSTGVLGRVRELDLEEWISAANAQSGADDSDMPWSPDFDNELAKQADAPPAEQQQQQLGDAA